MNKYDFSGYVTRNDIRCADGRTIRRNAFAKNDGQEVPLVWNHDHSDPNRVLGHVLLENRDDGVYGYGSFNETDTARTVKALVEHGDIKNMSIYANGLRQTPNLDVMHGQIREVSLVLAGANPGAYIQTLEIQHSAESEDFDEFTAEIYTDSEIELSHAAKKDKKQPSDVAAEAMPEEKPEESKPEEPVNVEPEKAQPNITIAHADEPKNDSKKEDADMAADKEKTIGDVFDEFTDEQKKVVYYLIAQAVEAAGGEGGDDDAKHSDYTGGELMHNNVFENAAENEFLMHADEFYAHSDEIFDDAKRMGSLKDAVIEHAATYGIDNINYLFPDARTLQNSPDFIKRDDTWVSEFMDRAHKSPFARVKSIHANITEAAARAKGYIKGTKKANEVFTLLKRETTPGTVYKHQQLDRADILDTRDFDVVMFVKQEMRIMLDEEIARAALIGDGRDAADNDKISEQNIRPIWTDNDLYTVKAVINVPNNADDNTKAKILINGIIRSRKEYKGSGNPIFFTTEDTLTTMLLAEDGVGRPLYEDVNKLATKLRVSKIVTVEVMEGQYRTVSDVRRDLVGIIINPVDYNFGADKGGEISLFDDFDIDYNQMKFLIETHVSGALTKPYSAIAVEMVTTNPQ